jgi:hypothetical protein
VNCGERSGKAAAAPMRAGAARRSRLTQRAEGATTRAGAAALPMRAGAGRQWSGCANAYIYCHCVVRRWLTFSYAAIPPRTPHTPSSPHPASSKHTWAT